MIAKDLISDVVPAISPSDTGEKALNWMDFFKISQLPIVDGDKFLGLISENDIFDFNDTNEPISAYNLSLFNPYIFENQHIFEVLELLSAMKLSIVPVLDLSKKYLGVIMPEDLLHYFSILYSVRTKGGIIVLRINSNDFVFTEIANIIESNDAKILSFYIEHLKDSSYIDLNIKLNTMQIDSIVKSFERYEYKVVGTFISELTDKDFYKDRYEAFLKYLNP